MRGPVTPENVYRRPSASLNTRWPEFILAIIALAPALWSPLAGIPAARAATAQRTARAAIAQRTARAAIAQRAARAAIAQRAARAAIAQRAARAANAQRTACRDAHLRPARSNLPAVAAATLCLIDRVRSDHSLRRLRPNRSLHAVAVDQTNEMVLGGYFGDDSRSGQTPLQRILATHYIGDAARASTAQNIGWGTGRYATPAAMVDGWMHSPPHRRIILTGAFRDIGVGVRPAAPAPLAQGRRGATYTIEFGRRGPPG